ncbi:MAG: alpha-1,2-fucosyltransferase [Paludibacter sp.]
MKFVAITGGLGNQMFIYAFCEELRSRGHKAVLFIQHSTNLKKYGHQGYELEKLFSIRPNEGVASKICVSLLMVYSHLLRLLPVKCRHKAFTLVGIQVVTVAENFIYYPEVFELRNQHELFRGTWQSQRFFEHAVEKIKQQYVFKSNLLNEKTIQLVLLMSQRESVSIHIRRGDYLSNQYANGFAGVCMPDYYAKAVEFIRNKVGEVQFYVFTDDPEWVNTNFMLDNAIYVQHNTGNNSWQDMYLMSRCKHNIIANSSFSWWGAWLNANPEKVVIAPQKWWRLFEKDDVVPENWIRL